MMHSELILRQVRLVMRLDAALPEIIGHPVELQQVILNLILNGAEAMGPNPPAERELIITTARHPPGIRTATVRDRGVGADPKHLLRMFESRSSRPRRMRNSEWVWRFAQISSMRTTAGCPRRTTRTVA